MSVAEQETQEPDQRLTVAEKREAMAKVSHDSVDLLAKVKDLAVVDQKTHDLMVDYYKAGLEIEKQADVAHDPVISHWFALHRAACNAKKLDKDKATEAKKLAKSKYDTWELEEERKRQEEERRQQEAARKAAEEDTRILRDQAEAEQKRQLLTQAKEYGFSDDLIGEMSEYSSAAIAETINRELIRRAAERAANCGASEAEVKVIRETQVEIIAPEAAYVPDPEVIVPVLPTVAPTFEKATGVSGRWHYSAKVTNLGALIKAAAANPFFEQYLLGNDKSINALARNSMDKFSLPGCELQKKRV